MDTLTLASPAFEHGGNIPAKYTCDGADVSPPLIIGNVPVGTKSLALIVDDPDAPAGTWVHWVLWNIAPETRELRERTAPDNASQGKNDFRKAAYGGPCPPSGSHRYFFKLYALDTTLNLERNSTKAALEQAMKNHVLARAELMGLYRRK